MLEARETMSKCGICGRPRRTGTGQQARFLTSEGEIKSVIACASCVSRGIVVIAPMAQVATTVPSDDADVVAVLRGLARQFESYRSAYARDKPELTDLEQRVCETWNTCADVARAWANERAARKPLDEPTEVKDALNDR